MLDKSQLPVITISREYGSGGHELGEMLARRLDIPFYDNELIALASRDSGYPASSFNEAEDSATNSILYAMKLVGTGGEYGVPLNNQLFMIQFGTIRTIADAGPAIIVGRCADYALRHYKPSIHVFIQSDMPHRIARIMQRTGETDAGKAEEMIRRKDKTRATYYNFYTDSRWGDRRNYDIVLNTAELDMDTAADILETYVLRTAGSKLAAFRNENGANENES